mmetsp:Transcript_22646/g.69157  ORF Transcript_22646/g.69157 Transcript_22646/m.69157 type:complete len:350 (-) Transcript_22646:1507-2556(-)
MDAVSVIVRFRISSVGALSVTERLRRAPCAASRCIASDSRCSAGELRWRSFSCSRLSRSSSWLFDIPATRAQRELISAARSRCISISRSSCESTSSWNSVDWREPSSTCATVTFSTGLGGLPSPRGRAPNAWLARRRLPSSSRRCFVGSVRRRSRGFPAELERRKTRGLGRPEQPSGFAAGAARTPALPPLSECDWLRRGKAATVQDGGRRAIGELGGRCGDEIMNAGAFRGPTDPLCSTMFSSKSAVSFCSSEGCVRTRVKPRAWWRGMKERMGWSPLSAIRRSLCIARRRLARRTRASSSGYSSRTSSRSSRRSVYASQKVSATACEWSSSCRLSSIMSSPHTPPTE